MDIFTLVAKLTLDSKDYEKALKGAEKDSKKAKLDAKGTLTATDHYTQGLNQAQNAARNFHGNASGTISAVDHYSGAIDAATRKGEQFAPGASDSITAHDAYTGAIEAAEQAGQGFAPGASDTISADDQYRGAIAEATTAGQEFAPGAQDDIQGSTGYVDAITDATTAGQTFAPGASDTITADDQYTGALDAAAASAAAFAPGASDAITADDQYTPALGDAAVKADAFAPGASDAITADDQYSPALETAAQNAQDFSPDASGDIDVGTDHYAAAMEADTTAAGDFEPGAEGSIGLTEDAFATAMSDDETAASTFSPTPSGDIALGDDAFAAAMSADETTADTFDPDADGSIGLTEDAFAGALADDISDAASAVLDASGTIQATDDYTGDLAAADAAASTADLDVDGTITIDESDVETSFENATEDATDFGTSFGNMVDGLERKLKAAGIVAAIGGITTAFRNAIHTSAGYADKVDKTSKALQMSTHDYQVWEYVLGQSGATMDLVSRGWDKMDEVAAGIDWSGMTDAMGEAFDPANFNNPADLFNGMMEALAGLEDKSRRADILEALFGPRGRQFNAFLDDGLEGLAQLRQEAEDLGLIMTDEDIANGVAFGDAIGRMEAALGGLRNKITGEIIPYLTEAVDLITKILTGQVEDGEIENTVSRIVTGLTGHATELVTALVDALSVSIPTLVDTFVSILTDDNFQSAVFKLVKTVYDAIKDGLSDLAVTFVSGGRYHSYSEIENELIKDAINKAGGTTEARRDAAAQVIVGEAESRPGVNGDWASMMTALGFGRGTFNTFETRVTDYLSEAYRKLADTETTDQEYYAILLGLKEFQDSINAGKEHNEAVQAAMGKQTTAMQYTADILHGMLIGGGSADGVHYRGSRYAAENGIDTVYAVVFKAAEQYLGRALTEAEKQAVMDADVGLPNWMREKYRGLTDPDHANITVSDGTISFDGTLFTSTQLAELFAGSGVAFDAHVVSVSGNTVTLSGGITLDFNPEAEHAYVGDGTGAAYYDTTGQYDSYRGYVGQQSVPVYPGQHAKGLWSVPYDDYIARLHRDEMVLTASQAREYRDGGGENAAIVGAIQELRNDMANLRIFVGERAFGQTVVDYSGRRLHGYLGRTENRQFAGYGWG